jgi:uncharacterized membrane protein YhhN
MTNVTQLPPHPLSSPIWLLAFALSAALALWGFERGQRLLTVVFKPLTTLLLLPVVGWPRSPFAWMVAAGLVASLAGDAVLLAESELAFLLGLGLFLVAHLTYIAAFATHGAWSAGGGWPWVGFAIVVVATPLLLRKLWPAVGPMRIPVAVYAAAISGMVVTAFATLGGPLSGAPLLAAGAVLFYLSDASLAVNRFLRPLPHPWFLSVGVYWLGQLGIALAARAAIP